MEPDKTEMLEQNEHVMHIYVYIYIYEHMMYIWGKYQTKYIINIW